MAAPPAGGTPPGPAPDPGAGRWSAIQSDPEFQRLVAAKRRFILPATVFFIVYYFALPILVGYFPEAMSTDVFGEVNVAYLFALSQFFMAWTVMWLYVRRARYFDAMEHRIVEREGRGQGGGS